MIDQLASQEDYTETTQEGGEEAHKEVSSQAVVGARPAKIERPAGQGAITGEMTELRSLPLRVSERDAARIADGIRKRKVFGLLGDDESVKGISLIYHTIWKVSYDVVSPRNEFLSRDCFINATTGEFVHLLNDKFVESHGLKWFFSLNDEETDVMKILSGNELSIDEIMGKTQFTEGKVIRILKKFADTKMIGATIDGKTGKKFYWLREKMDLPPSERHELLESLSRVPFTRANALAMERPVFGKEHIPEIMRKLWKNAVVKKIGSVYRPVWEAILESGGRQRKVLIDAVTGREISAS